LEALLELQDLHTQKRSLKEDEHAKVESQMFDVDIEAALVTLDQKLVELEERLDPAVRERYRNLTAAVQRAVVPVLDGTCYGCFVAVPTARSSAARRNQTLGVCDQCGRFLYYVD
jgi:predicted  nucleic acid-binding Zn-ribbon protein